MGDSLVLGRVRAIRGDIGDLKADMIEVKERLGFLEQHYSSIFRGLDRVGGAGELIKRRLNLVETAS